MATEAPDAETRVMQAIADGARVLNRAIPAGEIRTQLSVKDYVGFSILIGGLILWERRRCK